MTGRKKVVLLISFLFLIFLLLLFLAIRKDSAPSSPTPTPKPTPQIMSNLKLLKASPDEDPLGTKGYPPIQKITFTFNKPLNPKSLIYQVDPSLETEASYNETATELTIKPKGIEFWRPDVAYTITIKRGTQGNDGATLKEDIRYQIQAKLQGGE